MFFSAGKHCDQHYDKYMHLGPGRNIDSEWKEVLAKASQGQGSQSCSWSEVAHWGWVERLIYAEELNCARIDGGQLIKHYEDLWNC